MKNFLSVLLAFAIAIVVAIPQANAEQLLGGWSPYSCDITAEESAVFEKALSGFVGTDFKPVAVATQIVAGTNYSFFCNAKGVYPGALNEAALVEIYQPLEGDPELSKIVSIER